MKLPRRQFLHLAAGPELEKKLEARTRELSEAREQQAATAEVLRVISSSPTDLAPVFDIILTNATRLCEGNFALLCRYDGAVLGTEGPWVRSQARRSYPQRAPSGAQGPPTSSVPPFPASSSNP